MASPQTNLNALNGFNPLSYLGVNATTPPQVIVKTFAPLPTNTQFAVGTIWINENTSAIYMLVNLSAGVATWAPLETSAIFPVSVALGGTGDVSFTAYSVICGGTTNTGPLQNVAGVGTTGQVLTSRGASGLLPEWTTIASSVTITGNDSVVVPQVGGNFNIDGDGTYITTTGNAGTGTLTISGTHAIPSSFNGDAGTGTVTSNTFTINGDGLNIDTVGSAHKLQIFLAVNPLTTTDIQTGTITSVGLATLDSVTVSTFGAGLVTSSSGGALGYTAIPLSIANGGTNATSFTTDGVAYYNGTKLASTAAPTGPQVLGNSGGVPSWGIPAFTLVDEITIVSPEEDFVVSTTYYGTTYNNLLIQFESVILDAAGSDSVMCQVYGVSAAAYITSGYQSGYNYGAYNTGTLTNANITNGFLMGGQATDDVAFAGTIFFSGLQSSVSQNVVGNFSCAGIFGYVGGSLGVADTVSQIKFSTVGVNNFIGGVIRIYAVA